MNLTDWVLSLLGLHHPPACYYREPQRVDITQVNEAAARTAVISKSIVKNTLNVMEIQSLDKRPSHLNEQVEALRQTQMGLLNQLSGGNVSETRE